MPRNATKFEFVGQRIAPMQVAKALASSSSVHVLLPVTKVARLLVLVLSHFNGYLRLKIEPRNVHARELVTGALAGGAFGLALGIIWRLIGRIHPVLLIATTVIGAGAGILAVRYKVSLYVRHPNIGPPIAELHFHG